MYFQVKQDVYWDKNVERKLILSIGDWLVIEMCLYEKENKYIFNTVRRSGRRRRDCKKKKKKKNYFTLD